MAQLNGPRNAEQFAKNGECFAVHYISDKWARIDRGREGKGYAYAFIALQDYTTKTLGNIVRGGIYKPASFKVPAKHARGNVFSADNGFSCCGEYSVAYLK